MNKYHTSYKRRKQQKINDLCAKMREAKRKKREDEIGKPVEQRAENKHAMTITATDHRTGQTLKIELYEHNGNIRSYWVREIGRGWWTKTAGLDRVSKYLSWFFPRIGRFER